MLTNQPGGGGPQGPPGLPSQLASTGGGGTLTGPQGPMQPVPMSQATAVPVSQSVASQQSQGQVDHLSLSGCWLFVVYLLAKFVACCFLLCDLLVFLLWLLLMLDHQ